MNQHIVVGTDQNFKTEVLQSDLPVLVDLWAPWCGPCRVVGPVVEQLAEEYAGKLKVVKLNTEDNQLTAVQYGIMSIPTLAFFRDGKVVDAVIGAVQKRYLEEKIKHQLAETAPTATK